MSNEELLQKKDYDTYAVERLIEENKGLVISLAKKFLNRGYEMEDLIQLGNIGLFRAIKNFDVSKNVKFSTYAVPMILGEIKRFLRDDGIIKVSRSKKDLYFRVLHLRENIFKTYGYEPSLSELSTKLNVSYDEIVIAINALKPPEYIHKMVENDKNETYVVDKLTCEQDEFCDNLMDKLLIQDIIAGLSTQQKKIFYLRFFKDMTQTQIAKALNISQAKVSRLLQAMSYKVT